ncbi:MAG TPA: hypothetical protein DCM28_00280 [Phycisphaerales bacterium]|nr:hypothetical protein [Phycisphaerales bacterium]|tara:strand:- start:462 stop:1391 length:930 start_codon:yes stop_codon:yes gene_type:complete
MFDRITKNTIPRPNVFYGYTIIELLVVISIIVISVSIIVPAINKFVEMTYEGSAKNGISATVATARAYATRSITFDTIEYGANARYDGAAIIFTPNNRLRIVENIPNAITEGTVAYLEDTGTPPLNGFADISDLDTIGISKDTGIAGIYEASGSKQFIEPPFAIWFDNSGMLKVSDGTLSNFVFYDSNYNNRYKVTPGTGYDRDDPYYKSSSTYNMAEWDRWDLEYVEKNPPGPGYDTNRKAYRLPFEKLEAVLGIVLFSKRTYPNSFPTTDGCGTDGASPCSDSNAWIKDHGEVIFFSRYSGAIMKQQ